MVVLISRHLDATEVRVQEPESLQRVAGSVAIGCQGETMHQLTALSLTRLSKSVTELCSPLWHLLHLHDQQENKVSAAL